MIKEKIIGSADFIVRVTYLGDVIINGKFYKQLCFTPNQVALAIEDYLNGVPADGEDERVLSKESEVTYTGL